MSVNLNISSLPIKNSLSNSIADANLAAAKMATGEQYQHAYEDPTSYAVGLHMQSDLSVLQTVLKGAIQSTSMMYIAESAAKAIYATVNQMKGILAQAKLGYMTDELIKDTLSPTYIQLKAEINRIADSVNFNGQTLLNGQGGKKHNGISSTLASTPTYKVASNSTVSLAPFSANKDIVTGLSATTVTGGQSGTITFKTGIAPLSPTVSGGTITTDSAGNINVVGATLIFNDVTVADSSGVAKTGTGSLTITGVDLQFAANSFTFIDGQIVSNSTAAPTITNSASLQASNVSFTSTGGDITFVGGISGTPAISAITSGSGSVISNITQTYKMSGGVDSTSGFSFVTGNHLNTDIVTFELPNMRLNSNGGVLGMINTINSDDNILSAEPTDLTNLYSSADADRDIPLIEAMLKKLIVNIDLIGSYETRLENIKLQLQNDVEQINDAQSIIMDADLANETENFTRSNVKTNIAISCLKNLNETLKSLQALVA
jgi:flagellin